MNQAATYSATLHYLNAVKAAGTRDTKQVLEKMRTSTSRATLVRLVNAG